MIPIPTPIPMPPPGSEPVALDLGGIYNGITSNTIQSYNMMSAQPAFDWIWFVFNTFVIGYGIYTAVLHLKSLN